MQHKQPPSEPVYLSDLRTKDKLLASIHKISTLLTRPISLDTILTSIVKEISEVFGFTRLIILLANKDKTLLECQYTHGFADHELDRVRLPYRMKEHDCLETRVAREGKTIFVKDYLNYPDATAIDIKIARNMRRVSTLAVPLQIKRDIIGLITADKDDVKLKLTKKDIDAFATFANQASIIIENARLQEQNKKKIKQLYTLQEVSRKASSTFHLEKLYKGVVASALKLTKAFSCMLFVLDEEGKHLTLTSSNVLEHVDRQYHRLRVGQGLVGWVAQQGQPLLVQDVQRDERYLEMLPGVASKLVVPLISEKRILGVLCAESLSSGAFSTDDLKLLMIFAGHTASLIRNARLYGQVMTERNFREYILESSPNAMISINLRKQITSINKRTEEIFHIKRSESLGRKVGEVFEDEIVRIIDLALDEHTVVNRKEVFWNPQNGTSGYLGLTSSLLRNHQGNAIGAMLIVRDLTEEKRTDDLIRRLDRLTSLGQLSAGIAHEIRNPLASINFNVQLLAKKLAVDDHARGIIEDTQEGIDRIRTLVKGMLDFAKPSQPSLMSNSIVRILKGAITLMDSQFKKKKIEAQLTLCDEIPEVVIDAHQIHQVFVNLLLNGMEAMPRGGRIDIVGRVIKGHGKSNDQAVLQFTDHGMGISGENLGKIFNPFFTTKTEGTGLGLSIVHKILEQHNASVDVESEEGKGTTFTLKFPMKRSEGSRCIAIKF
jgi:two-component system NtrC family sensor kinase